MDPWLACILCIGMVRRGVAASVDGRACEDLGRVRRLGLGGNELRSKSWLAEDLHSSDLCVHGSVEMVPRLCYADSLQHSLACDISNFNCASCGSILLKMAWERVWKPPCLHAYMTAMQIQAAR